MERIGFLSTSSPFAYIPFLHGLNSCIWPQSVHTWHPGTLSSLSASLFQSRWQLTHEPVGYRVLMTQRYKHAHLSGKCREPSHGPMHRPRRATYTNRYGCAVGGWCYGGIRLHTCRVGRMTFVWPPRSPDPMSVGVLVMIGTQ